MSDGAAAAGRRRADPLYTGRTAWARSLAAPVRDFLSTETGSAVALLGAAVLALVWANAPWSGSYESFWTTRLAVRIGDSGISLDLRHWVNEGLMTFFFLVVGLEAKRELDMGELRERKRITIPVFAAVGGATVPILVYLAINAGGPGAHGWGAAMSTDTAFALGVLALVAPGGTRLRVFLLSLAVVDDLVALVVIAVAYADHIDAVALAVAVGLFCLIFLLRFAPPVARLRSAAVIGVGVWVALYESGVDPVVAGLAVGLVTTAYPPQRSTLEQVTELARSFREQPTPELARSARLGVATAISPNERLQYSLHPWTGFVIVPLFALANAGIQIDGGLLSAAVRSPVTLGIVAGYVVGKPLGIIAASWLASRRWLGRQRLAISWPVLTIGGAVAGIGFTVSLLISSLAFSGRRLDEAKLGILAAAVLATVVGWLAVQVLRRLPASLRGRQLLATSDQILDLSSDVDPERDHVRGGEDALVTLVEYGDYECPYCREAEVVINDLLDEFGTELRYVWRHLPLSDVHRNAQVAAEAAEAAAAQDAFWEMHARLLARRDEERAPDLDRYAAELGLDVDRFQEDLRAHRHAARIGEDVASADASGVAGTPSFFLNGTRHQGAYDIESLTRAINALRRREQLRRSAGERLTA